jgi:acyl dehydratase
MPISYEVYEKLLKHKFPDIRQTRVSKDTMSYALSVGMGFDPMDTGQLRYVYEEQLLSLPTMAVVICMPFGWIGKSGIGFGTRSVQGHQTIILNKPVPVEGTFLGRTRIASVVDKGEGKGMLVTVERELVDEGRDELVATLTATSYCRGDGGFGGPTGPLRALHRMPDSFPQFTCDLPTVPQLALMYRLNGDPTPLHADPEFAKRAGFSRPIMHGLCTMGISCHALLKVLCDYDSARMRSLEARFTAPVFPGEMLRTEMWKEGAVVSFRTIVPERNNLVVLDNGRVEIAG